MQTLPSAGGHGPRRRRCPEYRELGMAADAERRMVRRMDRPKVPHAASWRRLSTLQGAQTSRRQDPRNKFPASKSRNPMSGCLEAVGAHDRDGDMGVAHQECEDIKQDRKDENRSRRRCQPVCQLRYPPVQAMPRPTLTPMGERAVTTADQRPPHCDHFGKGERKV
jgi:hypothetical protein